MDVRISAAGVFEAEAIIRALRSGPAQNRVLGPSLLAWARVVRDFARRPNRASRARSDDFRDRTPAERARAGFPSARGLRKSIRAVGVTANYSGRRYRRGRAAVTAGGTGARQAYLVHEGHGGPVTARPYRYLRRAYLNQQQRGLDAFLGVARERFARLAASLRSRPPTTISSVQARTISRRHRSR